MWTNAFSTFSNENYSSEILNLKKNHLIFILQMIFSFCFITVWETLSQRKWYKTRATLRQETVCMKILRCYQRFSILYRSQSDIQKWSAEIFEDQSFQEASWKLDKWFWRIFLLFFHNEYEKHILNLRQCFSFLNLAN